jgi:fatty-acyl-CoA synthase
VQIYPRKGSPNTTHSGEVLRQAITDKDLRRCASVKFVRKAVWQMVAEIVGQYPDRDALIHMERGFRCNYRQLESAVEGAARGMIALGLDTGDRIALWAPNIPEWIIAFCGIAAIGAITVPVDPGAREDDLRFILEQSQCRAIIMAAGLKDREYVGTLGKIRGNLPLLSQAVVVSEEAFSDMIPWSELLERGKGATKERFRSAVEAVNPEDTVAIMYTSGTTGQPKGVELDHLGLLNKSVFSNERLGLTPADRANSARVVF